MGTIVEQSLARFNLSEFKPAWGKVRRGIEKESLRVSSEGRIAMSPHPAGLGSALTNPFITTDFSEALLEFITPVNESIEDSLDFLDAIHRYTYSQLQNDELLWACSMPCPTGSLDDIPIARYGNSNIGQLKTLYRRGLHNRYGSLMQTIAGIHYNFSMPDEFWTDFKQACGDEGEMKDFRTARYLHLIRNFHRYSWLLLYLFGASPVTCRCFADGREHNLIPYDDSTLYLPHATCLRMGNLGYRSEAQKSLFVCYNDLESYVESLNSALQTTYGPYEEMGTGQNGEKLQMNTNLLQLENEFYSTIRPKRITRSGERPLTALLRDGIEYIEVRALDLDPFQPVGIGIEQAGFLDTFMLYCLLTDSPDCNREEQTEVSANLEAVVSRGRDPDLKLSWRGEPIGLNEWASSLLEDMQHAAVLLDDSTKSNHHASSLATQKDKVTDPNLTPSGKLLLAMEETGLTFYKYATALSEQHRATFMATALNGENKTLLEKASTDSLARQLEIEASDEKDFDTFLAEWNRYSAI